MKFNAYLSLIPLMAVACSGEPAEEATTGPSTACAGDGMVVSDAWMRTARPGQPTSAAYFTLCNGGQNDDALVTGVQIVAAILEPGRDRHLGAALADVVDAACQRAVDEHVVDHSTGGDHDPVTGLLDTFDVALERALVDLPHATQVGSPRNERFITTDQHGWRPIAPSARRRLHHRDVAGLRGGRLGIVGERRRLIVLAP